MCCKSWKTLIPFLLTFICGVLIVDSFEDFTNLNFTTSRIESSETSKENGGTQDSSITPLLITHKPKPNYTDEAQNNLTQGNVTLRVTFLANGTIGSITPVSTLPNGLTESSIEAARKIAFHPATKNGRPISVTKTLQFTFTIY